MLARLASLVSAGKRRFQDLSEQEILALAISSEEEDGRIYAAYAAKLRTEYPATAAVFDGMAAEEDEHRRRLIKAYQYRFGDFVVPLRREHVADFYSRRPVWLVENLGLDLLRDLFGGAGHRLLSYLVRENVRRNAVPDQSSDQHTGFESVRVPPNIIAALPSDSDLARQFVEARDDVEMVEMTCRQWDGLFLSVAAD